MVKLNLNIPESFYREEIRDGYTVSADMKKVWAVELDLLNEFIKLCDKYQLTWFADAGTILGAVRHGGMIPWDDDIDVMMLREDYDKFCEIAKDYFKYPYFFQTPETDPFSIYGHAKIRNSETTAILNTDKEKRYTFNQGIFLDVFPIDNIPDDDKELAVFTEQIFSLRKMQWQIADTYKFKICKNPIRLVKRLIKYCYYSLYGKTLNAQIVKEHDDLLHKYDNLVTKRIAKLVMIPFKERRIWPKTFLQSSITVPFEMLSISIPEQYEALLDKFYGNWKKKKKGTSSHGSVFFDTEKSYKNYIK